DLLVDRQDIFPGPLLAAVLGPVIEVLRSVAHPDRGIQRMGSAKHLASRKMHRLAGSSGHRDRVVVPIVFAVPQLAHARQVVDGRIGVLAPGLEYGDPCPASARRRATTEPAEPAPTIMTGLL